MNQLIRQQIFKEAVKDDFGGNRRKEYSLEGHVENLYSEMGEYFKK